MQESSFSRSKWYFTKLRVYVGLKATVLAIPSGREGHVTHL
jgi:hypothetical protein